MVVEQLSRSWKMLQAESVVAFDSAENEQSEVGAYDEMVLNWWWTGDEWS